MLTNQEIWKIALQQSAYDSGCLPEDFLAEQNVVTISQKHPLARKYLKLPLSCDLVSYGTNIVAQASEEIAPLVKEYIDRYPVEHCFETPNLHVLDEMLRPYGQKICFMAEYFLPDVDALKELPCEYELRVLHEEIAEKAEEVLTDKEQLILVYCRSGRRSKIAAEALVELGYTNIKEFGGIIDWPYEVE